MLSAIDADDIQKVRMLLSGGMDPNLRTDSRAAPTFLTHSAYRGRNSIIRLLVSAGGDLEAPNGDGYTPLMVAVAAGRLETVRLLLSYRVNVNAVGFRGETPLALAKEGKSTRIAALLTEAGARE
jgi:ankyrin repeat protein